DRPCVLISSTKLGGIGRSLQCLTALRSKGIDVRAVIHLGNRDAFTCDQVERHSGLPVFALEPPSEFTPSSLLSCAERQRHDLEWLRNSLRREREAASGAADDRRAVWHPYTPLVGADDPLVCVGAHDEFLELADGRRVIDAI